MCSVPRPTFAVASRSEPLGRSSTSSTWRLASLACLVLSAALSGAIPDGSLRAQEPESLAGHGAPVNAAVYSPDAKLIATAGSDQLVKLWNADSRRELRSLEGHQGQVLCLAIAPDGRMLVSGAADNTLRQWDVPRDGPAHVFEGHAERVAHVATAPNGRLALSAGADGTLRLWDLEERKIVAIWEGHAAPVGRVAYRSDNNEVASADDDGAILIWNVLTGKPLARLGGHVGPVAGLAYHPNNQQLFSLGTDGLFQTWQLPIRSARPLGEHAEAVRGVALTSDSQTVVSAAADQVQVLTVATGQLQRQLEGLPSSATAVATSSDNALVAVGHEAGGVELWNLAAGTTAGRFEGHVEPVHVVRFHPDNARLATGGQDGTLRLWRRPEAAVPLAGLAADVLASSTDARRQLIAVGAADNTLRLFSGDSGQAVRQFAGHESPVGAVQLTGDAGRMISGDAAGETRLWDATAGTQLARLGSHAGAVTAVALHPDGSFAVTAGEEGTIKSWTLPIGESLALAGHAAAVTAAAFEPGGTRALTGCADNSVRIFDTATGAVARQLAGQTSPVTAAAWIVRPDLPALVVTGGADGQLRFWNADTGEAYGSAAAPADAPEPAATTPIPSALQASEAAVTRLAYHAASQRLGAATADGTVRFWQLPTAPRKIATGPGALTRMTLSPDGSTAACLATVQDQPAVILFDARSGDQRAVLLGHAGSITAVEFSPDSKRLITGGSDNTARIWNLEDAKFPQQARLELGAAATAVALAPDGKSCFTATADNVIRRWSLDTDVAETAQYTGHSAAIARLIARDARLYSAAADSTVRIWNLESGAAERTINHGGPVQTVELSADAAVLASSGADGSVKVWKAADGAAVTVLPPGTTPPTALAFSRDGRLLATSAAGGLRLWDVSSGTLLQFWPAGEWPMVGVGFLPPTQQPAAAPAALTERSLVVAGAPGELRQYAPDLVDWIAAHETSESGGATGIAFVSGSRVVTSGSDSTVKLWNLAAEENKRLETTLAGPAQPVVAVAADAGGQRVAAADSSGAVFLWNLPADAAATEPLAASIRLQYAAPPRDVDLAADGKLLAIVGDDQLVRVWDVENQVELERFFGHAAAVTTVSFNDQGHQLLTGAADNGARVWTRSAAIVRSDPENVARALRFSPDGATLFAGGDDPRIAAWPVKPKPMEQPAEVKGLSASRLEDVALLPAAEATPESWSGKPLHALAVHPSLPQLSVLDADGRVTRWDLAERKIVDVVEPLPPPEAPAAGAADLDEAAWRAAGSLDYDPTGAWLGIAVDRQVRMFDVATGKQLEVLTEATRITGLRFAALDRLLVMQNEPAARAQLRARTLVNWWPAHEGGVESIAFTPDGTGVLSCGADGVTLWNLEDGQTLRTYDAAGAAVTDVALGTDGSRVYGACSDNRVRVWPFKPAEDPPADQPPKLATTDDYPHSAPVRKLNVSANNQFLLTSAEDGLVRLWNLELGRQVQSWSPHEGEVNAIAIGADNKTIVSAGTDKTLATFNVAVIGSLMTNQVAASDADAAPGEVAAAPGEVAAAPGEAADPEADQATPSFAVFNNATQLATATGSTIRIWTLANQQIVRELSLESPVVALAVRADGAQLVAAGADDRLSLFNLADGQRITRFKVPARVHSLEYAADNLKIVAAMEDGGLRFYGPEDGRQLYELQAEQALTSATFTPDSRAVVTTGATGAVQLWAYASPSAVRTLSGHGGNVYSVAYSADGTRIASCSADQSIRIWDAQTGTSLKQLTGHEGPVYSVAFSPDGALVVSCGADNSIRLWDVVGGRQLKQLPAGDASLYSVAFHPNGRLVAAAGLDKKIYIYDVLAGTLQSTLEGHDDYIYRVSYNRDGTRLLSCGYGGNLKVWNAANAQPLLETKVGDVANFADYSPENDQIVVAGGEGEAALVELPANVR